MLQTSKIYQSRNSWKNKAIERADEIREHRKTISRYKQKILELKEEMKNIKEQLGEENLKKNQIKYSKV